MPGRESNIPDKTSFLFKFDHHPGVFQEVKVGTIPLANAGKVNPCTTYPLQGNIIRAAVCNRVQGHHPLEDTKSEPQELRGQMDNKRPVVQDVEGKEAEEQEEDDRQQPEAGNHNSPEE